VLSVAAAKDGGVWLGAASDGVNRWDNGRISIYRRQDGLRDERTQSLFASDDGRISCFQSRRGGSIRGMGDIRGSTASPLDLPMRSRKMMAAICGSVRMRPLVHMSGGKAIEQIPWRELGQTMGAWALVFDSKRSGL